MNKMASNSLLFAEKVSTNHLSLPEQCQPSSDLEKVKTQKAGFFFFQMLAKSLFIFSVAYRSL